MSSATQGKSPLFILDSSRRQILGQGFQSLPSGIRWPFSCGELRHELHRRFHSKPAPPPSFERPKLFLARSLNLTRRCYATTLILASIGFAQKVRHRSCGVQRNKRSPLKISEASDQNFNHDFVAPAPPKPGRAQFRGPICWPSDAYPLPWYWNRVTVSVILRFWWSKCTTYI